MMTDSHQNGAKYKCICRHPEILRRQEIIGQKLTYTYPAREQRYAKGFPFAIGSTGLNKQKEYGNFLKTLTEIEMIFERLRALENA